MLKFKRQIVVVVVVVVDLKSPHVKNNKEDSVVHGCDQCSSTNCLSLLLLVTSDCPAAGRRNTLSWCEKHPLRCLTPNVALGFSHTHTATWSSAAKKPQPFTQSVTQLHLWAKSVFKLCGSLVRQTSDRSLFVFVLFDYLWAISRLGFPMMIMTCMIGMCYLLATHVGLGWNM